MGYRPGEGDVLANLGLLCHHLGEDETAREYYHRALEIGQELSAREIEAYAMTHLSHALLELGNLGEATNADQ
jgi:tetratricopeptide (TPR) repeat protein